MLVNSKHNIRKSTYNCAQDSPLIRTSSPTQVGVRLVVPLRKSSWEMQIAVLVSCAVIIQYRIRPPPDIPEMHTSADILQSTVVLLGLVPRPHGAYFRRWCVVNTSSPG